MGAPGSGGGGGGGGGGGYGGYQREEYAYGGGGGGGGQLYFLFGLPPQCRHIRQVSSRFMLGMRNAQDVQPVPSQAGLPLIDQRWIYISLVWSSVLALNKRSVAIHFMIFTEVEQNSYFCQADIRVEAAAVVVVQAGRRMGRE
ncbi:unnamed protein product [Toxocara canis]|uniref:Uncharacterized protein n=1 Tax=Toxocara canis TaxID=6265 RepID=A0A183VE21_TOXCA|nr:unnamed protein product [Toxocara canis]